MATRKRIQRKVRRGLILEGFGAGSLARWSTCSCHPQQYGLKKAQRRARRRAERAIIRKDVEAG